MKNKVFLSVIFILLGLILVSAFKFTRKYKSDSYKKEYLVMIASMKSQTENMVSYNVLLGNNFKDKFIMKLYKNDEIDVSNYTGLKYGQVLNVTGKIVVPEYMNNPGEFNYKYYLYSNKIYGELVIDSINSKEEYKLSFNQQIHRDIYNYKEYLGRMLEKHMTKERAGLTKSILYGETVGLDEKIEEGFKESGLSHLMAVSGANITSIVTVLSVIIYIFKIKGKIGKLVIAITILAFVILTGSSLSTLRAGIMAIVTVFTSDKSKKLNPLKSWTIAAVLILIYAPYSVFNTGCILSFLATLGIIILLKPLSALFSKLTDKIKYDKLRKLAEVLCLNLSLTLSVQTMILPVQINSFNLISLTQVIFNILISCISNIIISIGAVYILFAYIPVLNFLLVKIINICIIVIIWLVNIFKSISLNISVMDLPMVVIILYYLIIFSFVFRNYLKIFIKKRKYKLNKNTWKKYYILQIILATLTIIILIANNLYFVYIESFVYFFNVGQGEMSYIKSGQNSVIVDIGSLKTNLAYNTISNYFKMKNITGVDAIVISHMHADHINGLEKYLENYTTRIILYSKPSEETEQYLNFKELVKKYNVNVKEVKCGEIYSIGDINIEIFLPQDNLLNVEDSVNANSLVCKIDVKDMSLMYMGDGTKDTEDKLLKLYDLENIDILKVAHHGSKTSTTEEFIKNILPKYAVISAKKAYYNHPHESVLEILKKYNVNIYITEKVGAIKFNMYNF